MATDLNEDIVLFHLPEETHSSNKDTQLSRHTLIQSPPTATRQVIMAFTSLVMTVDKEEIEKDLVCFAVQMEGQRRCFSYKVCNG